MEALAAWLGTLFGAVLKQCAPVLAEIIAKGVRDAITNTAETGRPAPDDPQQRAFDSLLRMRDEDHPATAGDGGNADQGSAGGGGHGPGQGRETGSGQV